MAEREKAEKPEKASMARAARAATAKVISPNAKIKEVRGSDKLKMAMLRTKLGLPTMRCDAPCLMGRWR